MDGSVLCPSGGITSTVKLLVDNGYMQLPDLESGHHVRAADTAIMRLRRFCRLSWQTTHAYAPTTALQLEKQL